MFNQLAAWMVDGILYAQRGKIFHPKVMAMRILEYVILMIVHV